jgi:hypothetical protein
MISKLDTAYQNDAQSGNSRYSYQHYVTRNIHIDLPLGTIAAPIADFSIITNNDTRESFFINYAFPDEDVSVPHNIQQTVLSNALTVKATNFTGKIRILIPISNQRH